MNKEKLVEWLRQSKEKHDKKSSESPIDSFDNAFHDGMAVYAATILRKIEEGVFDE